MKNLALLLLLLSFTAKAQLELVGAGPTIFITSGVPYADNIVLTGPAVIRNSGNNPTGNNPNDDKAYIISGNISGAHGITVELSPHAKVTFSGATTYEGSTNVISGELILTNTSGFKSIDLKVSGQAALTINPSVANVAAYNSRITAYPVFGSASTGDIEIEASSGGQVNFKGGDMHYRIFGARIATNSPEYGIKFKMSSGTRLNIDGGNWYMAEGLDAFYQTRVGPGPDLNVAANSSFHFHGIIVPFAKVSGAGRIICTNTSNNNMTMKIGGIDATSDWHGIFSNSSGGKFNIEKVGTGTVTCTNNNVQNGTVTISAGTLSIGNGLDIQNTDGKIGNGDIIINNNATLIFNQLRKTGKYESLNLPNSISGKGNFIKKGDRSISLSGGNTFTVDYEGTTTVEGGELVLLCRELKSSAIIMKDSTTLTPRPLSTNEGVISSVGGLSLMPSSTISFEFKQEGTNQYAKLVVPTITAPLTGFLIKLSGQMPATTVNNHTITLIQCSGPLPARVPTIIENSIEYFDEIPTVGVRTGVRRCVTLAWVSGTGLQATFHTNGVAPTLVSADPVISPGAVIDRCVGTLTRYTVVPGGTPSTTSWTSLNPKIVTITPDGEARAIFNGRAVLNYSYTKTNTNGCVISAIINVKGHVIRPDSKNGSLCVGNKIKLIAYDSPKGGSDSNHNWTSENWRTDHASSPIASVKDEAGRDTKKAVAYVTLNAAGSVLIKFRDSYGCTAEYTIMDIKNRPLISSGMNDFCPGTILALSGGGTAAGTDPWISADPLIATVDSKGVATGIATGSTTITYTDHNGCKLTKPLVVKSTGGMVADAGENKNVCIGNSVGIGIAVSQEAVGTPAQDAISYSWSPSTGLSNAHVANPTANPTVTTPYTLSKTLAGAECSAIARVVVTVIPLPVITSTQGLASYIRPEGTIVLTTTAAGSANPWATTTIPTRVTVVAGSDPKNATVTGVSLGDANITYTDSNGCMGSHTVIVTNKSDQTINSFTAIPDKTVGDQDFDLTATASSSLTVSFSANSDKVEITGNKVKIKKAGKVTIMANQAGNDTFIPAPQLSNTFCIKPSKPGLPTYNASNKTLTSTADHGNQWYLNGVSIPVGATGKTYIAATDGNYTVKVTIDECESASSDPVSVSSPGKTEQRIEFTRIENKTVGGPDFTLGVSTTSNLPLTFTYSDKVLIDGRSVKILKAGKVAIRAEQAGNETYKATTQLSNEFCINPPKPLVIYTEVNKILTSLSEGNHQWYLNGVSIPVGATGKTYIAATDGNYTVKVTIDECESASSDPVSVSSPGKTEQRIEFTRIENKTVGGPDFTLGVSTTSNLPLTFTYSDKVLIDGRSVKILKAGKVAIRAEQAGNETYKATTQLSNEFCINPPKPLVIYTEVNKILTSLSEGNHQWYLNGVPIREGGVGRTCTANTDGNYMLKVSVETCESEFSDATSVSASGKTEQKIEFTEISPKTVGDPDFTLDAKSDKGLVVTYVSTTDKITISGNSAKFVKAGKAAIRAEQAGNETYKATTKLSNEFCIKPAKPLIIYTESNKTLTSTAEGNYQWYLNAAPIREGGVGKTYTANTDGNYMLKVSVETCESAFSDAISVSAPGKTTQTITFTMEAKTVGGPDFSLNAIVSSSLPLTYSATSDKVLINGNTAKFVKAGKATIRAEQAGNETYKATTQLSNEFCINPPKPLIIYTESNKTLTSLSEGNYQWYLNAALIPGAVQRTYAANTDGNYMLKVSVETCESEFSDATSVSASGKTKQEIEFPKIEDKTMGGPDFTLGASSKSGLVVTYVSTTDKITITGNSAKIVKAGKAAIRAEQAGNDTYQPATQMSNTFCINPPKPVATYNESDNTLTSTAPEGNKWYLDGKEIPGATEQKFTPPSTEYGNYTVQVTIEECMSASESVQIVVTGDVSNDELQIFPNPVHDQLQIELPSHENGMISLFSVTGQNLYSTAMAGKASISMEDFPAGIYILKIQTAGKLRVKKVVKN